MHLVHLYPVNSIVVPCTWKITQYLYANVASLTPSSTDGLYASLTYFETHEVACVPSQPLGAPQVYYVENKGQTPCPLLLEVQFIILEPMEFIKILREPNDMHY